MSKKRNVSYYLAENGKFIIENYDLAKPFASFFPGIAGLFGIPMWVFYVNRGQGIVSFGTQDKKNSILEFFPANRAWEVASSRGFRTFVKINGREVYEPFQNNAVNAGKDLQRLMSIGTDDFSVSESNRTLGLQFNARYFTLANEPLACLIRILTIKNTSKTKKTFEVIDGLPQVVPFGLSDRFIKELGRTMEAWMQVEFHTKFKVPCYKLSVDPTDRPQVFYIKGGNFYYSWSNLDTAKKKNSFIVDPEIVFGPVRDFSFPQAFGESGFKLPKTQITRSKTPSAFSHVTITLEPGREATLTSLIGHAQDEAHLGEFVAEAQNRKFLDEKSHE
ncbi:MAG: hypothetical protein PHO30_08130, partial [Candidatus Omnitrophica bacterium]|nr:hypothetical protein [Candidatus Omnitrophota bacterium]